MREYNMMNVCRILTIVTFLFLALSPDPCTFTSCQRSIRVFKPPPHSSKLNSKTSREIIIKCDRGYFSTNGKAKTTLKCVKGSIKGTVPVCKPNYYSKCGFPSTNFASPRARIVGGRLSKRSDWPWVVRIFVKGEHRCGGTLINKRWVLTAAHCFNLNERPKQVQVSFPDHNRTILEYFIHQQYDASKIINDIALIKIPRLKTYSRHKQRICLPSFEVSRDIIKAGSHLHVVGWGGTKKVLKGRKSRKEDLSKKLKQARIPYVDDMECAKKVNQMQSIGKKNWYFNNITQFCAGDKLRKADSCHGDSGGPAMVLHHDPVSNKTRWYQVGIVSWGHGCAQKDEYSFYTRVSAFINWIENKVKGPTCSPPVLPLNSRVILPKNYNLSRPTKYRTRLFLACKSGYYKVGRKSMMSCEDTGQWEVPQYFKCLPRVCGDPGRPANGERHGLLFHFKSNVSFSCQKCYKLVGPSHQTCTSSGKWSGYQPVCQRIQCPYLFSPKEGYLGITSRDCGVKVKYFCKKGYSLVGPVERLCNDSGQWTGAMPTCKAICGKIASIRNGWVVGKGNLEGDQLSFRCQQNYTLDGPQRLTCQFNRSWSGRKPTCKAPCSRVKDLAHGRITTQGVKHSEKVYFECTPDYVLEGNSVITCLDGRWSGRVPRCLAPCAAPIKGNLRSVQKLYRHGKFGRFSCDKGFILLGVIDEKKGPQCLNGTWNSPIRLYCLKQQTVLDKIKAFFG